MIFGFLFIVIIESLSSHKSEIQSVRKEGYEKREVHYQFILLGEDWQNVRDQIYSLSLNLKRLNSHLLANQMFPQI